MNAPSIRFKGFTEDWKKRKLGDVIEDYVDKTTIEDQFPVLTSSQQKGIVLQDEYFSGERVSQNGNIGYFVIPRGYFAYRSRSDNDVFVFNRNDAIDMGIISYFYPVFKPIGVDSDFLLRRLNYGLKEQIKINSEGTGQHVLSLKKFKKIVGLFPSYEEQKLIGRYFNELDNLITLHQRKCDSLKQVKKYMLQKMFPKQGEKVPEIRFAGFTGDWEQRKVENIITDMADGPFGSNLKLEHYTEEKEARIIQLSNLSDYGWQDDNTRYTTFGHAQEIKRCIVHENELVMGKMMPAGMTIMRPNNEKMYVLSSDCVRIKLNNDLVIAQFFLYITKSDVFLNQINSDSQGSTRVRTSISKIRKMDIMLPSVTEQLKIGKYFSNLDNLITLHQRKSDSLKEIKKFMLQNMFPRE